MRGLGYLRISIMADDCVQETRRGYHEVKRIHRSERKAGIHDVNLLVKEKQRRSNPTSPSKSPPSSHFTSRSS